MPAKRSTNAAKGRASGKKPARGQAKPAAGALTLGTAQSDILGVVLAVVAVAMLVSVVVPSSAVVTSAVHDFLALSFGRRRPAGPGCPVRLRDDLLLRRRGPGLWAHCGGDRPRAARRARHALAQLPRRRRGPGARDRPRLRGAGRRLRGRRPGLCPAHPARRHRRQRRARRVRPGGRRRVRLLHLGHGHLRPRARPRPRRRPSRPRRGAPRAGHHRRRGGRALRPGPRRPGSGPGVAVQHAI